MAGSKVAWVKNGRGKNGLGQKWPGQKRPGQKWLGSKMAIYQFLRPLCIRLFQLPAGEMCETLCEREDFAQN